MRLPRAAGWFAGIAAIAAAGAGIVMVALKDPPPVRLDAGDPELVALGARIYDQHCAVCHGANLEGQPDWRERLPNGRLPAPPHDATGHTWHHPDDVLFTITKKGIQAVAPAGYESDMPAYEGVLTDEEIRAVLSFIKSRWPADLRKRQEALSRRQAGG